MTPDDVRLQLQHLRARLEEMEHAADMMIREAEINPDDVAALATLLTMHGANGRALLYQWAGKWIGVCAAGFPLNQGGPPHAAIDVAPCVHHRRSDPPPCPHCGRGRVFVTLPCPHCGRGP